MKASIEFHTNLLCYEDDDPHYCTEHQGKHAALHIKAENGKDYMFRCPAFQYGDDTLSVLEEMKNKINQK
jgi:hypothetical protein